MAIDATKGQAPATSIPSATGSPVNPTSQMGKQDFMKLLVAQLKNQDPLNPMDSREMVTQLSQLTSVEKLTSVDQNLGQLRSETTGMAGMQATSLIGRKVTADANHLSLLAGSAATASYTTDAAAASVKIDVKNSAGRTIRTLDLGPQPGGPHTFNWDGLDDTGQRIDPGTYAFEVTAKSDSGQRVAASSKVSGLVSEVSFKSGTAELVVGNARVSLGDIVSIVQP